MTYCHGFPPIAAPNARVLILGSMPSQASLEAREYYAHPRNAFWRIMEAIMNCPPGLPYQQRCSRLVEHRIALWDVLKTCVRTGSLDSSIDDSTIVPNDFARFFERHSEIRAVYFNGAKAEGMFGKFVRSTLPDAAARIPTRRLPSTSPANASVSFDRKLAIWSSILD